MADDNTYFVLDWGLDSTSTWSGASTAIALDKNDVFLTDPAGNFRVTLTPPSAVPAGTTFAVTATSYLLTNAVCGLSTSNDSIATPCTVSAGVASCTTSSSGSSFVMCCYNIVVPATVTFTAVTAALPLDSNTSALMATTSFTAPAATITAYSYATSSVITTELLNATTGGFARITAVTYSQVNQDSGIGKVTFTVNLPREPVRNMRLTINGDLSAMQVGSVVPRCVAAMARDSYGSNWNTGDALIATCSASSIASATNTIVVTTQNMIYRCGGSYTKNIFVSLWPVYQVNYNTASASAKSFKVNMVISASTAVARNDIANDIAGFPTTMDAKPKATLQAELCNVSSITPRIPGEVADYTFDFDLDTNKGVMTNTTPNEVTIFFPQNFFGSFTPNLVCTYNSATQNCVFTDEGILNIKFSTALAIGSGKKLSVTVAGIVNPTITDDPYLFVCTVNNANFATNARTNLLVGTGRLTGKIQVDTSAVTLGALRFFKLATPVSERNPRNTSVHKFRVAFDTALGLTNTASNIAFATSPVVHIYFPREYPLSWYTNKPTVTVEEYTLTTNTTTQAQETTKTATKNPTVSASGNRVTLTFTDATYTFAPSFRYWDITLTGVVNPLDTTVNAVSASTRQFSITLTNTGFTHLYRTYSNQNNYVGDALTTAVDSNLAFNRGNTFNFDGTKWVVDFYSDATQLNTLLVRPGRYYRGQIQVRSNNSKALTAPWVTTISLTDNIFKVNAASYTVSTSYNQAIDFWIGCNCGTTHGYYLVNFTSSDTTNFAALSPVQVAVDNSQRAASIVLSTPPSIPAGGSYWLGYYLEQPNVEALTINWAVPDGVTTNDASAKLTSITIPAGTMTPAITSNTAVTPVNSVFSITSTAANLVAQQFRTTDPSACYSFNGATTVSFSIGGSLASLGSTNLSTAFRYANADTDNTITAKNSLKFTFTAPVFPLYVYCALACINTAYPADADIIASRVASNNNYLQYTSMYVKDQTPVDIVFSGLVRGMQYHLRCIATTTQADSTLRNSTSVNFEASPSNANVTITPSASASTQCVQWQLLADLSAANRNTVVNYCQRLFSASGYFSSGCVICTFSDMTYNAPGLNLPTNVTCPTTTKTRLRFLQAGSTTGTTTTTTTSTLTVCPVAHPICATDVPSSKPYSDMVTQLANDLKTTALFKTNANIDGVQLNTTTPTVIISDSVTPDITKLTASVTSFAATGAVAWTASYASPLVCNWQISDSTTAPTFSALSGCTDASWCGKSKVGITTTTLQTSNLKAFTAGSTYNVYMGCTNDIPMAQRQSAVRSVGSFTIPAVAPSP